MTNGKLRHGTAGRQNGLRGCRLAGLLPGRRSGCARAVAHCGLAIQTQLSVRHPWQTCVLYQGLLGGTAGGQPERIKLRTGQEALLVLVVHLRQVQQRLALAGMFDCLWHVVCSIVCGCARCS